MRETLNYEPFIYLFTEENKRYDDDGDKLLKDILPSYLYDYLAVVASKENCKDKEVYGCLKEVCRFFVVQLQTLRDSKKAHEGEWGEFYKHVSSIFAEKYGEDALQGYNSFVDGFGEGVKYCDLPDYQATALEDFNSLNKVFSHFVKLLDVESVMMDAFMHWATR